MHYQLKYDSKSPCKNGMFIGQCSDEIFILKSISYLKKLLYSDSENCYFLYDLFLLLFKSSHRFNIFINELVICMNTAGMIM